MNTNRRTLLKGLSLSALSPLLTPFVSRLQAELNGSPAPKRFLFVVKSSGLTPAELAPQDLASDLVLPGEEEGWPQELRASDRLLDHSLQARVLPESLKPLEPFQNQLTILQGLSGKMCRGGHSAWYGALGCYHTGDEGNPGRPVSATVDGALAKALPSIFPHIGLTLVQSVVGGEGFGRVSWHFCHGRRSPIVLSSEPGHGL